MASRSCTRRSDFRLDLVRREIPGVLLWLAAAFLGVVAINWLIGLSTVSDRWLDALVLAAAAIAWAVTSRPTVRAAVVPWTFAAVIAVVLAVFVVQMWLVPTVTGHAYIALILIIFPTLALTWAPVLTVMGVFAPLYTAYLLYVDGPDGTSWIGVSVAAIILGIVCMRLRISSVDALGVSTALAHARSTRDRLTGTLNRHGLEERMPELAGLAARMGEPVFAVFIDIDGLKLVNDAHGHALGDSVIQAVADAVRDSVRVSDLLARWGGDEFIVVGMGRAEPPESLANRISERIKASGIDLSRWPGQVSLGMASSSADEIGFDALLDAADQDMYVRRARLRARSDS